MTDLGSQSAVKQTSASTVGRKSQFILPNDSEDRELVISHGEGKGMATMGYPTHYLLIYLSKSINQRSHACNHKSSDKEINNFSPNTVFKLPFLFN